MFLNILMFGWEFPPLNSGGLGTACYGLTKALANKGNNIKFVLPKSQADINVDFMKLIIVNNLSSDDHLDLLFLD